MPPSGAPPREGTDMGGGRTGAFPLLDGYRAIAAFMVLTTHVAFTTGTIFTPLIGPIVGRMDFGVTLFFLLSGFLLYRPWARTALNDQPGPRLGTYALRRGARILPAYWVMVAFTLALLPEIQPVAWQAWPTYFSLLHIYLPGFTIEGLTQTWSLATEVAFYVLLPMVAWLAGRRHRGNANRSTHWQLAVLACGVAVAWAFTVLRVSGVTDMPNTSAYWLPGFLDWFALGMALAVIEVRLGKPQPPRWMMDLQSIARAPAWCLVIATSLFVIAATPLAGPLNFAAAIPATLFIKHLLYGAIAVFLLLPGFLGVWGRSSTWARVLTNPVIVYLGTISYGVFLWHLVLLRLLVEALDIPAFQGGFWILWPLTVLASVAVASVSWFALERPLQRLTHRPRQPQPAPPAPVSAAAS